MNKSDDFDIESRDQLISDAEDELKRLFLKFFIPLNISSYLRIIGSKYKDEYSGLMILDGKPLVYDCQAVEKAIVRMKERLVDDLAGLIIDGVKDLKMGDRILQGSNDAVARNLVMRRLRIAAIETGDIFQYEFEDLEDYQSEIIQFSMYEVIDKVEELYQSKYK